MYIEHNCSVIKCPSIDSLIQVVLQSKPHHSFCFFPRKDPLNQHIAGTMWMALWNTLLIYQKIEKGMPVLLFLIPGWYQFSNRQSMSLQEFIVAGGYTPSYSHTDTVLSLLPGATSWTSLASLPLRLWTPRASVVGGKMRVVGGYCSYGSCSSSNSRYYYRTEVMKIFSILVLFVK